MMKILYRLPLSIIICLHFGCTDSVNVKSVYNKYCNPPYLQEWDDGCIKICAQLMTYELRAAMDFSQQEIRVEKSIWDSVLTDKQKSAMISFRIRIDPIGKCIDTVYSHNSDIVYGFGRSDQDREQEIKDYHFALDKKIWMNFAGKRIDPIYCHTEQNFGMDNGRDVWVGFTIDSTVIYNNKKEPVLLFFQGLTPICDIASLKWSTSIMKNMINGGHL